MSKISKIILSVLSCLLLSSWVYAQKDELIFSHKKHVEELGAECATCHTLADSSLEAVDNLLPTMESCYDCHDQETECKVCHTDPENPLESPRISSYIAKFPHAKHVAQEMQCATCHIGVAQSESVKKQHLPTMGSCVSSCHNQMQKVDYCYDCHGAKDELQPVSHRLNWNKVHGVASHADKQECKLCHIENQCVDCHQKDNLDRKAHPFNFRNNHGVAARSNQDNCYTCHEQLSFCVDCHRQELVLPRNHSRAGWSNLKSGGGHARSARQNLDVCMSCHVGVNTEPVCANCHKK